jgi:hypothetical protein
MRFKKTIGYVADFYFFFSKCAPDDAAYNYVLSQRRSQLRPKKFIFF